MGVKEGNMFGKGGSYDLHIKHDLLTGRMFRQEVINGAIKKLREEMNVETKASAKDQVSYDLRKKLAEKGIQPIDSVSGHFVGIKVAERQGGEGTYREAFVQLADDMTGEIDTVVLNLNSGAGQMAINKLKQVAPGENIALKLFSSVTDKNADGTPINNKAGEQITVVNHFGAINRADGSKITLDGDTEVKALHEKLTAEREALAKKKASKELLSASINSIKVDAAMETARFVEGKMDGFKFGGSTSNTEARTFNDGDVAFGGDGSEAGFDAGTHKPRN